MKLLTSHTRCLTDALREISFIYRDKKYFIDLGCGAGVRTLCFDNFARRIYAVDRLDWLTREAKNRIIFSRHDFVERRLPFEDGFLI